MNVDFAELRLELAIRREVDGVDHVTSGRLADRMEYSPQELGAALSVLEDIGQVQRVARTKNTTWRILL